MGRVLYRQTFVRQPFSLVSLKQFFLALSPGICLPLLLSCSSIQNSSIKTTSQEVLIEEIETLKAVAALGQLIPAGEIRRLAAPISGFGGTPRVSSLLVKEGDFVEQGQILAVFDNRPQILSDLAVIESRLQTLNIKIRMQQREVARYKKVASQGAASLVLLEDKKDELIKLKGHKNESIAEINGLKADLDNTQLRSPIDGIVLVIHAREGERSGVNGVLEIGANKNMHALIEVYESDIKRVNIGQQVTLFSENGGFNGNLKGLVERISPHVRQRKVLSTDPTGDADARVIEVTVILEPSSSRLVSNLTGMKVIARFEAI